MSNQQKTNRLINETSPYLLQHAHNPVDWYPWGEEALARAHNEDKAIFLSIGYSACHWCHVMERESFEKPEIAAVMNRLFVNIKVDREERPDLDAIYMDAVQAMTQSGGWPMSVFLTPNGQPFYGGTYYPPEPRYGMPSFYQVLKSVSDAYQNRREKVMGQAEKLTELLNRTTTTGSRYGKLGVDILDEALENMKDYFDEEEGGFGSQPKFPQPMTLDFAISQYLRTGDHETLTMAELTLEKMALGGIYDQLGGGFARYSVDAIWLVPHFEKMLYDNGQLLRAYLHLWLVTKRPLFKRIVDESIDYILREMAAPDGGFYSAQDADSEGVEGKFFVWSPNEIEAVLGVEDTQLFNTYYGVSQRGNFEGKNILNVATSVADMARRFQLSESVVEERLKNSRQKLFDAREKRVKPARDDKILTEWNGLMIHALAECAVALGRADALQVAEDAANFILAEMSQSDGKLYRSFKDERARFNAYLEDYAAFIRSLIALYESTFNMRWLDEAKRLTAVMFDQFHDSEQGGFFQTGIDHEALVVRRKDFIDNAIPSGNAMAVESLLRLAALTGNTDYREIASPTLLLMQDAMAQQPTGFGRLLSGLDTFLAPSQEIAIVGDPESDETQAFLQEIRNRYLPNTVLALKRPGEESQLPLLAGRELVDGQATLYLCKNYACQLPVTTAEALTDLLNS